MTVGDPVPVSLPSLRTFQVRRPGEAVWVNTSPPFDSGRLHALVTEGIEAHRMDTLLDGTVVFYRYLRAYPMEVGMAYDFTVVRQIAPNTYYDITEVTDTFVTAPVN